MSIDPLDNLVRPVFHAIVASHAIHTHLGLFQQVRSEARKTLMPKQLVGYNTRTYVITTQELMS